jgi:hypothetical protein
LRFHHHAEVAAAVLAADGRVGIEEVPTLLAAVAGRGGRLCAYNPRRRRVMSPCLRYLANGLPHVWWFAPRAEMVVDLAEPDLAHALDIARAAGGTAIRMEFHRPGVPGQPALTVHFPW